MVRETVVVVVVCLLGCDFKGRVTSDCDNPGSCDTPDNLACNSSNDCNPDQSCEGGDIQGSEDQALHGGASSCARLITRELQRNCWITQVGWLDGQQIPCDGVLFVRRCAG